MDLAPTPKAQNHLILGRPTGLRTRETRQPTAVLILANDRPPKYHVTFFEGPLFSL